MRKKRGVTYGSSYVCCLPECRYEGDKSVSGGGEGVKIEVKRDDRSSGAVVD